MSLFRLIIAGSLFFSVLSFAAQEKGQHILKQGYSVDFFMETIQEPAEWVPYPGISEVQSWRSLLPPDKYAVLIEKADDFRGFEWPLTRASVFLEYVENGNRTNYQKLSFARREALAALVIGELLEGKGRYLKDIVDGIWLICEETFWGVPAHLSLQERGHGLPDVEEPVVDLFAAETAALLAWTSHLIGDSLDEVNPLIRERIYVEIDRRMFRAIESKPNYRWMGYNQDADDPTWSYARRSFMQRRPNNWNPWISSNLLTCILLLEKNKRRRAEFVHQVFDILDNYLEPFPADGGSDEGTGYWGHAAGSTFESLDLVSMATGRAFNPFDEPLLRKMGEFLPKAYIGNGYYINFADASPKSGHSPMLVFRFGKAVDSQAMMGMGAHLAAQAGFERSAPSGRSLLRTLPELYFSKELLAARSGEPLIGNSWWPDIQLMVSRDREDSTGGLFLSAKAGHNEESHNHNDVGSFIVFHDGFPVIIDIGSATYTRNYGNEWVRDSAYHNLLPLIDGKRQQNGLMYAARDVKYSERPGEVVFRQDIAGAYGEETGLKKWQRVFTHRKGKSINIADHYEFESPPESIMLPMMLVSAPSASSAGELAIKTRDGEELAVRFDREQFDVEIEEIQLQDTKIADRWGGTLYRVLFTMKKPARDGDYTFTIRPLGSG